MNKVVTIHLNGTSFQIEEQGYSALQIYLDEAARRLVSNPYPDEVLLDLEQAIADKCRRFLRAAKDVVLTKEIDQILEEMGPVQDMDIAGDGAVGDGHAEETTPEAAAFVASPRQPRKLYRLRNDRMVEGICAGIGAYTGVDPTIIRVIAVVLLILTGGMAAAVYLTLIVVVPEARTPEEHAAAHGAPFNAQEVLERARSNLAGLQRASEQRWQQRRLPAYWNGRGEQHKGCLGIVLTLAAFIAGVSLLMSWLRWPFHSAAVQDTLIIPYEPWGTLIVFVVLITGLGVLLRKLARSERGANTLLFTVLNVCLVILVLMFVIYLAPHALAGIVNAWNWLIELL